MHCSLCVALHTVRVGSGSRFPLEAASRGICGPFVHVHYLAQKVLVLQSLSFTNEFSIVSREIEGATPFLRIFCRLIRLNLYFCNQRSALTCECSIILHVTRPTGSVTTRRSGAFLSLLLLIIFEQRRDGCAPNFLQPLNTLSIFSASFTTLFFFDRLFIAVYYACKPEPCVLPIALRTAAVAGQ